MNQVFFVSNDNKDKHSNVVNEVYRLRHETFIERMGWNIPSHNGMERDSFDELNPFHIAVANERDGIIGCWRALPTTGDYMLRSVFPELLQGEHAPEAEDVWEISRFAVRKNNAGPVKGYSGEATTRIIGSLYQFAKAHGVNHYLAVTTVGFERILRNLGLTLSRLGEGNAMQIGVERSVAIRVEVNEKMKISLH